MKTRCWQTIAIYKDGIRIGIIKEAMCCIDRAYHLPTGYDTLLLKNGYSHYPIDVQGYSYNKG